MNKQQYQYQWFKYQYQYQYKYCEIIGTQLHCSCTK